VLTNLTSNAIQHGDPSRPITVTCSSRGDDVAVAVHNHGAPIPRELQRAIFDPFRRIAESTGGASANLGLGLYIAQQIARAHGGDIAVRSSPESGTEFALTLPRRAPEPTFIR
jgi:signal transduction histidine kinase